MKNMKVAIVADIMTNFGGAEKVTKDLISIFPEADFYTLFILPKIRRELNKKFPLLKIYTSWWQFWINRNKVGKYISIIKFWSWIYWERLDLSKYNLVISSSHSFMSKNVKKGKSAVHVSYVHTPPRYLYDEYNEIDFVKNGLGKYLFWPFKKILEFIDKQGVKNIDVILVNSENVKKRVKKYYKKDSIVVYPGVKLENINTNKVEGDYYVCLSRLVKQKGIDLAIKAFNKNGKKLLVLGMGVEYENLKKIAKRNIIFLGEITDSEKYSYLKKAKALIYTSIEEDFGIVPVESLLLGTPVIAFKSGGVEEVVIDKVNGLFFRDFEVEKLNKSIELLAKINIDKKDCINSAKKFSDDNFRKKILEIVKEKTS